ncbi:alpha/beta fold hydrolase [Paenibacillus lutrae]|uniref:Alpha/beta fold hydrolase n=1 Tax=Paenibacillus lutrae TaxID=2078573 RepID=A0A7X3FEG8_9BACL|nr:alpha/beta hydrolase [Paenibacillus lutrae]MVO97991.1 alpha/beta fold hydrolase [Paenibacillus lutrae]
MGFYIPVERGVNIYVEDLNPGGAQTALFIHGWPLNHLMYEYQLNQLPKAGIRCVAIDLRGFGKSDKPWEGYSYNRLADDLRIVIDTLQLDKVTLVGFSVGGAIAIRYMAKHAGHRVERLALLGAAAPSFTQKPGFPHGMNPDEVNLLIQASYTDRPQMIKDFGSRFFARYISVPLENWFHSLGLEASGHATAMVAASLRDEDLRHDLSRIAIPTIILHGLQDQICPFPLAEATRDGIKNSQLIPFQYSGHGLFYCEVGKVNKELIRFITMQAGK